MSHIGERLKKLRQEKNISLEEIANKTNIKADYLRSIETGDFCSLPTYVHARGFVKIYGCFLGLDGLALSKTLSIEDVEGNVQRIGVQNSFKQRISWAQVKQELLSQVKANQKKIILAIVIFMGFLFMLYIVKTFIIKIKQHIAIKNKEDVVLQEQVVLQPEKTQKEVTPSFSRDYSITEPFLRLSVKAIHNVWFSVVVDGDLVFEGILSSGSVENWKAENNICLKVSNAGALKLTLNDNDFGTLGQDGEVIRNMVITKDGIDVE